MAHDTDYARWMARHDLSHAQAAEILGISESTSWQYATGINRTTRRAMEPPLPVKKLMRAKDLGVVFELEAAG